jgi:hypothetical protein
MIAQLKNKLNIKLSQLKTNLNGLRQKVSLKLVAKMVAGLVTFYLLFAYFAVNPIAQKLIPRIAEQSLASKATVGRVTFDPFGLTATINDFNLTTKRDQPLANFKKLVVDFELSGMFSLAWKFKQIAALAPQIDFATASDGQFNWDELIAKLNENQSPPSDTIPSVIIEQIVVSDGQIQYEDASRVEPFKTTLTPLNFALEGFSTLPKDRGDYLISAAFAKQGGILKWKGDMSVNPVASKGVVALDGVNIGKLLQLVKGLTLPIAINEGKVQTSFNYDFSLPETIPTVAINHFTFSVRDVAGKLTEGGDVALGYAGLSAPTIHFVGNKQPTLRVDALDFKLADLNLTQADALNVTLKNSTASLPQLDFAMQETPQLAFTQANLQFSGLTVNQKQQFSLAVPQTNINALSFDLKENQLGIKEVALSDIQFDGNKIASVRKQAAKPLATLDKASIADIVIALTEKKINAQSVMFSGLETAVIKQADDTLNWVKALESKSATTNAKSPVVSEEAAKTNAPAWQVALSKVALDGGNIHIQDGSVETPIELDIQNASLDIQNASLDMTKPLPVQAAFNFKQGGKFSTKGQIWPSPFKADIGLSLSNLSLKPFAPYLNKMALLKLNGGAVDVSGQLRAEQKREFALDFNGKFDVKQLAIIEEAGAPFLSWDHLRSDKLKVSLMPNQLAISTLQVIKPSGKFIINPDKSINLKRVMRNSAESAPPVVEITAKKTVTPMPVANDSLIKPTLTAAEIKPAVTPKVKPKVTEAASIDTFPAKIDAIRISDAKLEFADLSLTPQFGTNIHSLNGVINGFSTKAAKVAQIELDGKVDEYGSARIDGSLQPFNATEFMDIKLVFTNLDMSRLTPYSGKFAGRRIEAGKLSVDLAYKIKQQQLAGTNKFVINKIKLGEKVESSDAADLPLDLAIAILEDTDGLIDLDLPISGSLDDPSFSYGGIFWKAFKNVLTKIVTAPFRVLGKLFGGDGENFDGILFTAGTSEVSPPELEKLANVSKALAKREALMLGIVPSYNLALDTQAIKQNTYRQQVVEEMGVKLEPGQKPGPVDLANEDVQDAVDTLYNELTNKGLFKSLVSKLQTPEEGHYEKAQASLIESIEVTETDLKALALARAEAIKVALLANGISPERVSVVDKAEAKEGDDVKVAMKLDVKN